MAVTYPINIKYNDRSTSTYNVRANRNNFGDGYQEVVADGINNIVRTGTLVHTLIPWATNVDSVGALDLRTFLRTNCGTSNVVTLVDYMEYPAGDGPALYAYLDSWTESYTGTYYTFSVAYRESFNG